MTAQSQEEKRILETACSPIKPQKSTDNEGSEGGKAWLSTASEKSMTSG